MFRWLGKLFARGEGEATVIDMRHREPSIERLAPVVLIVAAPSSPLIVEAFKKAFSLSKLASALLMLIPSTRPAYVRDTVYDVVRGTGFQYGLPAPLLIVDENDLDEVLEIAKRSALVRRIPRGVYEVKVLRGLGLEPVFKYIVWTERRKGYAIVACHPSRLDSLKSVNVSRPDLEVEFLSVERDTTVILLIIGYDEGEADDR